MINYFKRILSRKQDIKPKSIEHVIIAIRKAERPSLSRITVNRQLFTDLIEDRLLTYSERGHFVLYGLRIIIDCSKEQWELQ